MDLSKSDRRLVTFYSYKGGVGRTMTLANVAFRLADAYALRVIAVDWDLEAPGLHRFFGLSGEEVNEAQGVLDYFVAYRDGLRENAPGVPDISAWPIKLTRRPFAPRRGSLSVMLAGRQDPGYVERMVGFDWQPFYPGCPGARAVASLRRQLVGAADIVLVDSRTGLADAGGLCTVQLPDGVVLMAGPNEQSLEGVERIARKISTASDQSRGGRKQPRVWIALSRVPVFEESYLASEWFKEHEGWFSRGASAGLWSKDDHPNEIRTYEIPHRARWAFGEQLLHDQASADPWDPVAGAFAQLTVTLLRWAGGDQPVRPSTPAPREPEESPGEDIQALQLLIREAQRRGDINALSMALFRLDEALGGSQRTDERLNVLEQLSGVTLGQGNWGAYAKLLNAMALAQIDRHLFNEAWSLLERALNIGREIGNRSSELQAFLEMGIVRYRQKRFEEALPLLSDALAISSDLSDARSTATILFWLGITQVSSGQIDEAARLFRESAETYGKIEDLKGEASALRKLLDLPGHSTPIPDAPSLRARLEELDAIKANTATPS
jgi:tetratricopeptide (TPR) repeat protein/CO dehydrogenase nickel-insertion accessory protein CooC1